jgi:phage terminase large subunit-like protein
MPSEVEYGSCLDVPFAEIPAYWDKITGGGKNINMIRALALWDRYFLLVQIMGRKDLMHPWLYNRCREVERNPDGHIDIWAREHYKSTIITYAGSIQEILRNPEVTIGIFSHTKSIARAFLRQIKIELETNEKLKRLFPEVLYDDPQADSSMWSLDTGLVVKRKSNPKEATLEAWGLVDGQPTSKHFTLLIYDDVVTRESVATPEQIAKTTAAWELSDNLGAIGGRKQMTGTRYSYADTYESIMKRGAAIPRVYPATHDGTITGKPVLFSQEDWDRKVRDQGEATISCQMLANPLAGHQRMFDVEDVQVYEVRPETLAIYIMIDPARSKKKDSDKTAMIVIGVDYSNNKYLLDGFNHRMDLMERWQKTAMLYTKWKAATGVQAVYVGYESFGAQSDLDYFYEQQKITRVRFEIMELAWPREGGGAKTDRVQRLGPDFRSHKFFVPYETDETNYTANQRKMLQGYNYRIASKIRRKDENGEVYDLTEQLKMQIHYFPFGGKVDAIDAASRIYDMNPMPPTYREQKYYEPEYT